MAYTLTYDASHKVKAEGGHAVQFFRHIARDADDGATKHTNQDIDPERTRLNITLVNDGDGGFKQAESSQEFKDYLDKRLSTVEKKLRKDAVIMRPLILQMSPKWFDEHSPGWRDGELTDEADDLTMEMVSWAAGEFGQENLVGFSLHLDEGSPQLHVAMTPVTSDGRLAQKEYFRGPKDFARQHDEFRKHMQEAGYDADMERSQRSKEHLSSDEYKVQIERAKRAELEVDERDRSVREAERRFREDREHVRAVDAEREQQFQRRVSSVSQREKQLDSREAAVADREAEAADKAARSAELAEQVRQLEARKRRLESEAAEAETLEARARARAEDAEAKAARAEAESSRLMSQQRQIRHAVTSVDMAMASVTDALAIKALMPMKQADMQVNPTARKTLECFKDARSEMLDPAIADLFPQTAEATRGESEANKERGRKIRARAAAVRNEQTREHDWQR